MLSLFLLLVSFYVFYLFFVFQFVSLFNFIVWFPGFYYWFLFSIIFFLVFCLFYLKRCVVYFLILFTIPIYTWKDWYGFNICIIRSESTMFSPPNYLNMNMREELVRLFNFVFPIFLASEKLAKEIFWWYSAMKNNIATDVNQLKFHSKKYQTKRKDKLKWSYACGNDKSNSYFDEK
jgi:hypothetical protein